MDKKLYRNVVYLLLSLFTLTGLHLITAPPGQAHWADMSAAEILVEAATVQVNLTYPTGLTPFADDDQNGQLSSSEIQTHRSELQRFLGEAIRIGNSENQTAQVSLSHPEPTKPGLQPTGISAPKSHSTVQLLYSWPQPVRGFKIHYNLFLPGVSTASCLATILQNHRLQTFVFTPNRQVLALSASSQAGLLLALSGAFVWGALHSLSPGHGKTLVGAYLVGCRATPRHALFLALTTTATHTVGIFSLGLVALFASRYVVPEQLYPWMNLLSGLMVVGIGGSLFKTRLLNHRHHSPDYGEFDLHEFQSQSGLVDFPVQDRNRLALASHSHPHEHYSEDSHSHHSHDSHSCHSDHSHLHFNHSDHNYFDHNHSDHSHSHLPPDGPLTWRNLVLLGISGGLIPCPAALVLLLSAIALGNVGLGLLLVGAFSLGLALVLTGLGLGLVYAKQAFDAPIIQSMAQVLPKAVSRYIQKIGTKVLPIVSAVGITAVGVGVVLQAVLQLIQPS